MHKCRYVDILLGLLEGWTIFKMFDDGTSTHLNYGYEHTKDDELGLETHQG